MRIQFTNFGIIFINTQPMSSEQPSYPSTYIDPSNSSNNNVLQNMTSAMKFYKSILQHIQSQYKILQCEGVCIRDMKIQQSITNLMKAVSIIHDNSRKKIFSYRLIGRFIQITTIYRNKCGSNQNMAAFRDHLTSILMIIRNYQNTCYTDSYSNTNTNTNNNSNTNNGNDNAGINLSHLFDKIIWVFKNITKQLNQICKKNGNTTIIVCQSKSLLQPQVSCPIYKDKEKQKDIQKQKDRRNSVSEAPNLKSLQYKYKATKQIIQNAALLAGMDLDVSHLRGLFFQARNNLADVHCDKIQANSEIKKCRTQYMQKYNQWKTKIRRKTQKKQRLIKASPSSPTKIHIYKADIENKSSPSKLHQNNSQKICASQQSCSLQTEPKMPKLFQNSHLTFSGTSSLTPIIANFQQDRKRSQFRNMQTFIFNRQFIHLSEIKNQRIARRPYAEVKQVLVAGDQLNYYSSKKQIQQLTAGYHSKASFFMQRAIKNQKVVRKKSYLENYRVPTQE